MTGLRNPYQIPKFSENLKIFQKSKKFLKFWGFSKIFRKSEHFLPSFLTLIFDPHFWPSFLTLTFDPHFWSSFLTLIFDPHFSPSFLTIWKTVLETWHLRHWLQFWQLRTWIQTIILTWQLIVTLDSIRNSCDVLIVRIVFGLPGKFPDYPDSF